MTDEWLTHLGRPFDAVVIQDGRAIERLRQRQIAQRIDNAKTAATKAAATATTKAAATSALCSEIL
jgi:hypothetical protein